MPRVRVTWVQGRTEEQRQALADRITDALVEIDGLKPNQVYVVFEELAPELLYKAAVPWSKRKTA